MKRVFSNSEKDFQTGYSNYLKEAYLDSSGNRIHIKVSKYFKNTFHLADLSMNILCLGDKSPIQRGFFKNKTSRLVPALRFLVGLYKFCNFVIMLSLM